MLNGRGKPLGRKHLGLAGRFQAVTPQGFGGHRPDAGKARVLGHFFYLFQAEDLDEIFR